MTTLATSALSTEVFKSALLTLELITTRITVHALKAISLADLVAREHELGSDVRSILRPTPYLRTL